MNKRAFLGTIIWIFIFVILFTAAYFYFKTSTITGNTISNTDEETNQTSLNDTIVVKETLPLESIIRPNSLTTTP